MRSQEAQKLVHEALRKLSPELREAVILRDLQDMDYKDIAIVLKVPEGTVKSRINRGRTELARLLQRNYKQVELMAGENQSGMQCVECEGLLAEALDGTLHGSTLAAFEAHQQSCAGMPRHGRRGHGAACTG